MLLSARGLAMILSAPVSVGDVGALAPPPSLPGALDGARDGASLPAPLAAAAFFASALARGKRGAEEGRGLDGPPPLADHPSIDVLIYNQSRTNLESKRNPGILYPNERRSRCMQ